tara:strand:+ start:281 stop:1279 length:999 start_codon:yes stop_codon:yes gene_type:complete
MALSKIEVPSLDVGQLGNRNLLINSEFRVNQRGITSLTGNTGETKFLADRWITYCNAVSWSASIQEVTLPDGTVTNSLKTVATTTSAGAFFHPFQKIETYGKDYLQGKKVVLSAWVRTNVAGQFIRICDSVNCHLIGTMIPADGQWHKVSAVHTMPTSMNTGANNFIQFQPLFNTVSLATNDYCEFALPQMELGYSEPTPFEHESYGTTLQKCMRYFQRLEWKGGNTIVAIAYDATNGICGLDYTRKRAEPTFTLPTATNATDQANGISFLTTLGNYRSGTGTVTASHISRDSCRINFYDWSSSGGTGDATWAYFTSNDSSDTCFIHIDAEL